MLAAHGSQITSKNPTINIKHGEAGAKVREDRGKDTTGLSIDEPNAVGVAVGIDPLGLLQRCIREHNHLKTGG
jgi:hypothetical protein